MMDVVNSRCDVIGMHVCLYARKDGLGGYHLYSLKLDVEYWYGTMTASRV